MMLYFHIPYCQQICAYCDFYKIKSAEVSEFFTEALCQEIRLRSLDFQKKCSIKSIYWGGGTPSLLGHQYFEKIMRVLEKCFDLSCLKEHTLEADPKTFSEEKIQSWKNYSVNRVSLGAQSFVNRELQNMGRGHCEKDIFESYSLLKKYDFKNINIDLILCTPYQNLKTLHYSLKCLSSLSPSHLSVYSLNLEENSLWGKLLKTNPPSFLKKCDEEKDLKLLNFTEKFLEEQGYHRYEISNYAKKRYFESKHNWGYWERKSYLGFGPSAHSYDGQGYRSKNKETVRQYWYFLNRNKLPPLEYSAKLSPEQSQSERLLLQIRTRKGIPLEWIKPSQFQFLKEKKMVVLEKNVILTTKGRNLYNEILQFLIA